MVKNSAESNSCGEEEVQGESLEGVGAEEWGLKGVGG